MEEARHALTRRPGLVTFAAIMMFILGGFELTWALVELSNAAWLAGSVYGTYNGYLWLWAILDIVNAGIALYAGYDILRGGSLGRLLGVIIAGFNIIRWFFLLPVAPVMALVVMLVDALILYGLLAHGEYFAENRPA